MVNLLSGRARPEPFPELDADAWEALCVRLGRCAAFYEATAHAAFQVQVEMFAGELDELESAPSLVSASSLLEAIDEIRREELGALRPAAVALEEIAGSLVCYFPGRSLSTGEAEVASRGYFDDLDRPPLWSWVAVVGRRAESGRQGFEVGILAWVAPKDGARAHAGCQASAASSVMAVDQASEAIAAQWRRSISGVS